MTKSLGTVVTLALAAALLAGCSQGQDNNSSKQAHKKPALPVQVTRVEPQSVDVYSKFPGRVTSRRQVQVVARVEGILQSRHYNEGHVVHKGQLLYQIDPRPFQATVDQKQGKLASDKATLAKNKRAWARIKQLYEAHAVSQTKRDIALSNLQTAQAQIKQDKASLESARIKLDYTHVKAPLTGVTSLREVDVGSLVKNGTKLTTITQLNPIYILFALPENDAIARRQAMREHGKKTTDAATRQAAIILSNGKQLPYKGKVDFTQSTINPQTGTVQLRAVVKNPDNRLMPGLYVRVRLRIKTLSNAIVVPEKTVFTGQARSYVFVVKDGRARKRFVTLGPEVASGQVVSKGLSPGDPVVVSGLGEIKAGVRVRINDKTQGKTSMRESGAGEKPARIALETGHDHGDDQLAVAAIPGHHTAGTSARASQ